MLGIETGKCFNRARQIMCNRTKQGSKVVVGQNKEQRRGEVVWDKTRGNNLEEEEKKYYGKG